MIGIGVLILGRITIKSVQPTPGKLGMHTDWRKRVEDLQKGYAVERVKQEGHHGSKAIKQALVHSRGYSTQTPGCGIEVEWGVA